MNIVGITGSIGSGKSEVARVFAEQGAWVLDADVIARALLRKGEIGYQAVLEAFGRDILDEHGDIDRRRLAARVFKDGETVRKINEIIHPLVHRRIADKLREIEKKDRHAVVVIDAPLLIEANVHRLVDILILVKPGDVQQALSRAARRIGISLEEAERRFAFQIPVEKKEKMADIIIENNGSLESLREKARAACQKMFKKEDKKRE